MGLPKKIKKDISLIPKKEGFPRRVEMLDMINEHGTYLPKSILHEDLDRGFLDFVKNDLEISTEGIKVPIIDIIMTTQNWANFTNPLLLQQLEIPKLNTVHYLHYFGLSLIENNIFMLRYQVGMETERGTMFIQYLNLYLLILLIQLKLFVTE